MPRKRRLAKARRADVTALQWAYLTDEWDQGEPAPPGCDAGESFFWGHLTSRGEVPGPRQSFGIREAWEMLGAEILEEWIAEYPGTRPRAWWRWNAPEARRRIGGTGTPASEVLAYLPALVRGIPTTWLEQWHVEHYKRLDGVALDPDDPPTFEAEAVYLRRLDLLTDEEQRLYVRGELDTDPEPVAEISSDDA